MSYTLNDGTEITVQEGESIKFYIDVASTYFIHKKAGDTKGKKYTGDDLSEVKLTRNGTEHLYHPHKAMGSTSKVMLETIHANKTASLLGGLPFEGYDNKLTVAYFVLIPSRKSTPRMIPNKDYKTFAASFGCKEIKQQLGGKPGDFVTEADMITAIDLYDQYCAE